MGIEPQSRSMIRIRRAARMLTVKSAASLAIAAVVTVALLTIATFTIDAAALVLPAAAADAPPATAPAPAAQQAAQPPAAAPAPAPAAQQAAQPPAPAAAASPTVAPPNPVKKPLGYHEVRFVQFESWRIAALLLSLMVAYLLGRTFRAVLLVAARRLERSGWAYRAILLKTLARTAVIALLAIGLRVGFEFLILPVKLAPIVNTVNSIVTTLVIAYAAFALVDLVDAWLMQVAMRRESSLDAMLVPMVRGLLRVTIFVLVSVQIVTTLSDKPLTSIIAGLGIGGLAVGLAGQEMVKNFFGSMMIFSDRPFEMGSTVDVAGDSGVVEAVGFRSTRLRTAEGYLIAIPNALLASSKVKNLSAQQYMKRTLKLGLSYNTTPEKLREALDIVRGVLENHEGMRSDLPPRVFFSDFQDSSLSVTATYWYAPPDEWKFRAFGERINLEIFSRLTAAGIRFATPMNLLAAPDDRQPAGPQTPAAAKDQRAGK